MPWPEPQWHGQRHGQGRALRVLRSLDSIALLMPGKTQADGERMAFLPLAQGWERKSNLSEWNRSSASPQKRTIHLLQSRTFLFVDNTHISQHTYLSSCSFPNPLKVLLDLEGGNEVHGGSFFAIKCPVSSPSWSIPWECPAKSGCLRTRNIGFVPRYTAMPSKPDWSCCPALPFQPSEGPVRL
jgi:hypothetical protein